MRQAWTRWAPLCSAVLVVTCVLLAAGTPAVDLLRYGLYAVFAVMLPGTLVYRGLRRSSYTLVEDLAMGVAVGLVLELAAWAAFSAAGRQSWLWLWPAAVYAPFAAVPGLRRCWWTRSEHRAPGAWSWTVAGVVIFYVTYVALVSFPRNPPLPDSERAGLFVDLPYELSLAGEAKHHFPVTLPQVAGEPLDYHWFSFAHLASASLISHVDLPMAFLRLALPGLMIAAITLISVVGWRLAGRPAAGAIAGVLLIVIGEVDFSWSPVPLFGATVLTESWMSLSFVYSLVLLVALIGVVAAVADGPGRPGLIVLAAILLCGSAGAKSSTIPVLAGAIATCALVLSLVRRRPPWPLVGLLGITVGVELLALAAMFHFHSYGLIVRPMNNMRVWWGVGSWLDPGHLLLALAVLLLFVLDTHARMAGVVASARQGMGGWPPRRWLLLGGMLTGLAIFLTAGQPLGGRANMNFLLAALPFGLILSGCGLVELLERARLSRRGITWLVAGTAGLGAVLTALQLGFAGPEEASRLSPPLAWMLAIVLAGLLAGVGWRWASGRWPALRGRGELVAVTGVLALGLPAPVMDVARTFALSHAPYTEVSLPRSRVDAARWVRDHSGPGDVLATNAHCLDVARADGLCDTRSFWLSAYAERRVMVEGWGFAPRLVDQLGHAYTFVTMPFWDPDLLARNDAAFAAPTEASLRELRDHDGVRWLVVDRQVGPESPDLRALSDLRFDNGRMAVYELTP